MTVWRLEMPQAAGCRFDWLGPFTSHWLTARAEEVVRYMDADLSLTRTEPRDRSVFGRHRALGDPLLCGCPTEAGLRGWFSDYLCMLQDEGGHLAQYKVPHDAVIDQDDSQVIFVQSQAQLTGRIGTSPTSQLIRSSAGSRAAIIEASGGKYDAYSPEAQA